MGTLVTRVSGSRGWRHFSAMRLLTLVRRKENGNRRDINSERGGCTKNKQVHCSKLKRLENETERKMYFLWTGATTQFAPGRRIAVRRLRLFARAGVDLFEWFIDTCAVMRGANANLNHVLIFVLLVGGAVHDAGSWSCELLLFISSVRSGSPC